MQKQDKRLKDLIARFIRIVGLFNKLDTKPYDFGTDERLYRSELHVLQAIGRGEGRTVTELGSAFGITKGAVSQVVGKLETKGYLVKERNPAYGKELLLSLSAKGKVAFKSHEALHARIDKAFLASMGPVSQEELVRFERFLGMIEEYMEKIAK
jgi:DNA-binding MarR family transcriptional regulator